MQADIRIRAIISAHVPLNVTDNVGVTKSKWPTLQTFFDAFRGDFDIIWINPAGTSHGKFTKV